MEYPFSKVPIERRILYLRGIVAKEILKKVRQRSPAELPENSVILFVEYAYADIPLYTEYRKVFDYPDIKSCEDTEVRLIGVTQQFGKATDEIPHGWKTICAFECPQGIPQIIENLPVVEHWFSDVRVGLSSCDTWQALIDSKYRDDETETQSR